MTATHTLEPRGRSTELQSGLRWTGPMAWLHRSLFTRKARSFLAREADAFVRLAESSRGR